jgi:hypothetical protein
LISRLNNFSVSAERLIFNFRVVKQASAYLISCMKVIQTSHAFDFRRLIIDMPSQKLLAFALQCINHSVENAMATGENDGCRVGLRHWSSMPAWVARARPATILGWDRRCYWRADARLLKWPG